MVAFNKAIMKHEARLPLHYLVRGVLANWGFAPSQLNPNAYKIMAGMHILWRLRFGVDPSVEEVCHLYKPSSKKSEAGYFFMAPWEKKKILMTNLSSSCEGWKDRNFWVGGISTRAAPPREVSPFLEPTKFLVSCILYFYYYQFFLYTPHC